MTASMKGPMMRLREVIKAAKEQGWRVEDTTDGVMLYPPDKRLGCVLVHRDPPEHSLKKAVSQMRHRQFVWPWPPKG